METVAGLLQHHPVFTSLDQSDKHLLTRLAISRLLQKGETLALQGEAWPYLFFVVSGEVDAVKGSIEGRNLLVTTFHAGELFWGSAFFQDTAPQLATLEAHRKSQVLLWSREQIEPVLIRNGRMSWELCSMMIQRMQRASAIVDDLAFQSVAGRLANLLLDHFDSAGEQAIGRSLTLDDMAVRIGTTREMVCRILYRFADKKWIQVTRTEFVLTDREGLTRLVDGN